MKALKAFLVAMSSLICLGYSFAAITFSTIEPDAHTTYGVGGGLSKDITTDENTFMGVLDLANRYLWIAVGVVCLGVLIYGGFKLLSAQGDEKRLKEANNIILGAFVGIVIASMGFAVIKIIVNLF